MQQPSECRDYKNPTLMHAALGYAALGLRVIPLGRRRKQPWLERWPQRATCDPVQIVRWFERWPEDNIGIATGNAHLVAGWSLGVLGGIAVAGGVVLIVVRSRLRETPPGGAQSPSKQP